MSAARNPHVIRLREPWEVAASVEGAIVLRRHFHRPTGVRTGDRVVLAVEGLPEVRQIWLNDEPLEWSADAECVWRAAIETKLAARNKVVIELAAELPLREDEVSDLRQRVLAAGLVRLEIEDS